MGGRAAARAPRRADELVAGQGLGGMPVSRPAGGGSEEQGESRSGQAAADRAFLPAKSLFEQVGNMMILTGKTVVATVRPPYPYGGEFIGQFLFALQLCWFPMAVSMVAFGSAPRASRRRTSSACSAPSIGSAASSSWPRCASSRPS